MVAFGMFARRSTTKGAARWPSSEVPHRDHAAVFVSRRFLASSSTRL